MKTWPIILAALILLGSFAVPAIVGPWGWIAPLVVIAAAIVFGWQFYQGMKGMG